MGDHVVVHGFLKTDRDRFHFAHRHATVGQETLEHWNEAAHALIHRFVTQEDATTAPEAKLASREIENVARTGNGKGNLANRHVRGLLLTLLNEVQIVLKERGVEHERDVELVA